MHERRRFIGRKDFINRVLNTTVSPHATTIGIKSSGIDSTHQIIRAYINIPTGTGTVAVIILQ
jgi:hypothetical protein